MRTTLNLDDDVAALTREVRKAKDASLKEVVNAALREGLVRMVKAAGSAQEIPHRGIPPAAVIAEP